MATTRIIVLVNLRPGKDPAAYEAWTRSSDLPTVNALPSIERFAVLQATGLMGSDAPPPYQYVEVIEISDMDAFGADVASEGMRKIAAEFQAWADPIFIMTRDIGAAA